VGDITRFPTAGHFASYNATAPIEASSGDKRRHRLNPRGNRKLNHALHIAAVSQLRYPSEGRDYYQKKIAVRTITGDPPDLITEIHHP
jgi:transposase